MWHIIPYLSAKTPAGAHVSAFLAFFTIAEKLHFMIHYLESICIPDMLFQCLQKIAVEGDDLAAGKAYQMMMMVLSVSCAHLVAHAPIIQIYLIDHL